VADLYLVDTSVWIFALRRDPSPGVVQRLAELLRLDAVATCGLVVLELLGGTLTEHEYARLRDRLRGLHSLEVTSVDWESAARMSFDLRRAGVTVPFTDALLVALARRHELVLLHADRDFDLISRQTHFRAEGLVGTISRGEA